MVDELLGAPTSEAAVPEAPLAGFAQQLVLTEFDFWISSGDTLDDLQILLLRGLSNRIVTPKRLTRESFSSAVSE